MHEQKFVTGLCCGNRWVENGINTPGDEGAERTIFQGVRGIRGKHMEHQGGDDSVKGISHQDC